MTYWELNNLKEITLAEGIRARVIAGENITITHVTLDKGAILPEHKHPQEQIVNVIEGELELTVEGQEYVLTRGRVFTLAPNQPHSGRALTEVYVIDVFQPNRADLEQAAKS